MNDSPYSSALQEWAAVAGYALNPDNEAWVFHTPGWGQRFYLRSTDALTLTYAERGDSEQSLISASSIIDIERFLTVLFGDDIRSNRHLDRISCASKPTELCPTCQTFTDENNKLTLVDAYGQVRAFFLAPLSLSDDVIWFSWILDASLDDLRASFLAPDGLPLFPGLRIGPARESA